MLTLPLQLFPASQIMERGWQRVGILRKPTATEPPLTVYDDMTGNIMRVGCLAILMLVAYVVGDRLADFVAIIGAVFGLPCNSLFPSLIYVKHHWETRTFMNMIPDVLAIVVTVSMMVYVTLNTVGNWGHN